MQTLIHVMCRGGESLRSRIVSDAKLQDYGLYLETSKRPERSPGWAKLKSMDREPGAVNVEWEGASHTLTCRVVTKNRNNPSKIVGNLVSYLLARYSGRIVTMLISQVK